MAKTLNIIYIIHHHWILNKIIKI